MPPQSASPLPNMCTVCWKTEIPVAKVRLQMEHSATLFGRGHITSYHFSRLFMLDIHAGSAAERNASRRLSSVEGCTNGIHRL